MNAGYEKYVKNSIIHIPKEKGVIMLVDGLLKYYNIAQKAFDEDDVTKVNDNLIRAQEILGELMASLNLEAGEWAENLFAVYSYAKKRLGEANIYKNKEVLDEVYPVLVEINTLWHEVYEKLNG